MFWCYVSAKEMAGFRELTVLDSDHLYDRFHACTIHTRNLDYEAAICFLTPRMQRCDLTGIRLAITCGRYVDGQDEFVVNLLTIAPSFFTSFIWTDPVVAEWCSIRQTNNLTDQDELGSKRN